jgi:hypothetical protein
MLVSDTRLQEQLGEIRSACKEAVGQVADELCDAVVQADAPGLLAQWEGFGQFCRTCLGVEPTTATAAFGLGQLDVNTELAKVTTLLPNRAGATRWAKEWSRGWERRFEQ